jgi:hypothetical protein
MKAFSLLYQLFQMSVATAEQSGPVITISNFSPTNGLRCARRDRDAKGSQESQKFDSNGSANGNKMCAVGMCIQAHVLSISEDVTLETGKAPLVDTRTRWNQLQACSIERDHAAAGARSAAAQDAKG